MSNHTHTPARTTRNARTFLTQVLDPDSFRSWDTPVQLDHFPAGYRSELIDAAERSGVDEAVTTGTGTLRGRPIALVVSEFGFMGGSIGSTAAHRICSAVRHATAQRLPILASPASGGTRMQEGTPAFVQMIDISRAVVEHRRAGLPYLTYLRDPTMGGVFASWGSLGQITLAEPHARIGFLGPKVHQALSGTMLPNDVQTAENLTRVGVIDDTVAVTDLAGYVDSVLRVFVDPPGHQTLPRRRTHQLERIPAWHSVQRTCDPGRITVTDLLREGEGTVTLSGSQSGECDPTIVLALTRLDGQPCILIGQDGAAQHVRSMGPGALRQAQRAIRLAEEVRLPIVTVIDTPGADLSRQAEEGALASEIARCIAALTGARVPTVSVLLGQGCGGAALALLPASTVIATEHAWLSPLPTEGASVIMHGDTSHASAMADAQHIRATDLLARGIVNHLIPERQHESAADLARAVVAECAQAISRGDRYRNDGT